MTTCIFRLKPRTEQNISRDRDASYVVPPENQLNRGRAEGPAELVSDSGANVEAAFICDGNSLHHHLS